MKLTCSSITAPHWHCLRHPIAGPPLGDVLVCLSVGGVSPVGDRRCSSESSRVLASWAAASRWRGHLLTVRSTALLVLSGCVVGDEGLVLLVCLTFVSLVRGVLRRGEEGAGAVDIDAVARFWNKRTLRCCCRLCVCVRQQGIAGTSLGWDSRPSCVVLFGDSFCSQQPLIGLRCQQAQF